VKSSEGLSNRVSNIIRRNTDNFLCICFIFMLRIFIIMYMYSYCYVWSVYFFVIVPTGTLQLPWLRFFRALSSVIRKTRGYNSQRQGTACTLPKFIVLFLVLFVCKCVLCYYHRVSTQLKLTNISTYQHTPLNWNQTKFSISLHN